LIVIVVVVVIIIHLFLTQRNEIVFILVEKVMIESLSLSMFDGLFDGEGLFFSCAVSLHGVAH